MKPRERLLDFVPEMYRALLPEPFERPAAEERRATCDRCAMCAPEKPEFSPSEYFSPSLKCCTYHPVLPNYSVGGLLRDRSAAGVEGRRRIQHKISERIGVTPFGILPPEKQRLIYLHGKRGFGRAEALTCPYLDQERVMCTIWSHREALCTTWFCKYNDGQDGRDFWEQMRDYLLATQEILSSYALRTLGFDVERILRRPVHGELDQRDLDDAPPSDAEYGALWGDWLGREQELYEKAYDLVLALDRRAFEKLGGIAHTLALDLLEKRHRAMREPTLPDPLLRNPHMRVQRSADGSFILTSYAGLDPLRVRKAVYDLLDHFDGRKPTTEVRSEIQLQRGVKISDGLLSRLYKHRIVVDPAVRDE
jgi:hypothetical protein